MTGPGVEVAVEGGMYALVGLATSVYVGVTVVGGFVVGVDGVIGVVFTDVDVGAGVFVAEDAPGVRKTFIHAGCVRMDGSRGAKKPSGLELRKFPFGSRRDSMLVSSLQLGAKRSAHPLVSRMQKNPSRMRTRMMSQSRRLCRSCSFMSMSIDWQLHKDRCAGILYFILTGAFKPDASIVRVDNAARDGKSQTGTSALEFGLAGGM